MCCYIENFFIELIYYYNCEIVKFNKVYKIKVFYICIGLDKCVEVDVFVVLKCFFVCLMGFFYD